MSSALANSYGAFLIAFVIGTTFYGVSILQAWLYFQWYPKDPRVIKFLVLALVVLVTLETFLCAQTLYWHLIQNFGDSNDLLATSWELSVCPVVLFTVSFIVQCYFARSIWILSGEDKRGRCVVVLIWILALLSLGAGIYQVVLTYQIGRIDHLALVRGAAETQCIAGFACDILITVSLCLILQSARPSPSTQSTTSLLNRLIIGAIQRGIVTGICAALNLILFVTLSGTFWFFIGLLPISKVYTNTMLAALNTREHIKNAAEQADQTYSLRFTQGQTVPSLLTSHTQSVVEFPPPEKENSGGTIEEDEESRDKHSAAIV